MIGFDCGSVGSAANWDSCGCWEVVAGTGALFDGVSLD